MDLLVRCVDLKQIEPVVADEIADVLVLCENALDTAPRRLNEYAETQWLMHPA